MRLRRGNITHNEADDDQCQSERLGFHFDQRIRTTDCVAAYTVGMQLEEQNEGGSIEEDFGSDCTTNRNAAPGTPLQRVWKALLR